MTHRLVTARRQIDTAAFEDATHAFNQNVRGAYLRTWPGIDLLQGRRSCNTDLQYRKIVTKLRAAVETINATAALCVETTPPYVDRLEKVNFRIDDDEVAEERERIGMITGEPIGIFDNGKLSPVFISIGGLQVVARREFDASAGESLHAMASKMPAHVPFMNLVIE